MLYTLSMQIVQVQSASEIQRVVALAAEIWPAHYNALIGPDQVAYMLATLQAAEPIAAQMRDGMCYGLLCSETAERTDLGYLAYKYETDHCFLSKLYLREQTRGLGLGRRALAHVCAEAQGRGLQQLRLTVSRENQSAIKAYLAWGFTKVDDVVIDIGNAYVMDDYLMQLDF